nr:MAG TPA: hypothetical protein [Caudoviricetes sp.]DAV45052.1 MAG TPA: hypothetical protein [Caudoviricetes sp.]
MLKLLPFSYFLSASLGCFLIVCCEFCQLML